MHGEFLCIERHDDRLTDAIKAGDAPDELDGRRRAMLAPAEKLTREPARMMPDDFDALRAHGFEDEDIYDLVFVVSFTNHMDRVADGLNAVVGDEEDRCRAIADASRPPTDS